MKYVYTIGGTLSHALDKETQRARYDPAKRRERYLRDKAAGKTGFKGILARIKNPFGNYASLYYDPEKARAYYQAHRTSSKPYTPKVESSSAKNKPSAAAEEATEDKSAASKGRSGGGGGRGGGGGGGGGASPNAAANSQAREDANNRIQALRESVDAKIQVLQDKLSANAENSQSKREMKKEEASTKMAAEREKRVENVSATTEALQTERDLKLDPIREENARLRGKLDSMNPNSEEGLKLRRQLASNAKKSMKACADYTDSLMSKKTAFSNEMNQNLNKIRTDLNKYLDNSSKKQQATAKKLRDKIKNLRSNLNKEIAAIRDAVSKGTYSNSTNYGSTGGKAPSGTSISGRVTTNVASGSIRSNSKAVSGLVSASNAKRSSRKRQ